MAEIFARRTVVLTTEQPVLSTPKIPISADVDRLQIRLRRPTAGNPLAWDDTATVEVTITTIVDGISRPSTSRFTGGSRLRRGVEIAAAVKTVGVIQQARVDGSKQPFEQNGKSVLQLTRPGERAQTEYVAVVTLTLVRGISATLEILGIDADSAPADTIDYHHSVAFDSKIDAQDLSGDGVISVTIDPVGTTDLAAFAGSGNSSGSGGQLGSTTYNGVAMSEKWDQTNGAFGAHAGYALAGIPSTSVSVVNTLAGSPDEHGFGVIVFTGVDQTTPTGTAVFGNGTTSPATNTVTTGLGAHSIVVDNLYAQGVSPTIGADQSLQNTEDIAGNAWRMSTQAGDISPATMSWTFTDTDWGHGAIAFKPPVSCAITGTATASITESDVVSGGKTIIATLTNDTYIADTIVTPVIEAADCTVSGSNTAQDPWAVSHPNASTGDLLIFYIAWDDSTTTTDVDEPAGPNSEVLSEINATPVTDSSTETRAKAWYTVATGSWTAGTISFNPSASESWSATCIRVPAGEFDSSTPIGAVGTAFDTTGTDTTVDSPAFTAGASDGDGKLVWCAGVDTDPLSATNPTGWTILQRQDLGAVAHGVAVRNTAVTDSESIASATWSIAGDSWTSIAFVVRAPTTTPFENARTAMRDGVDSAQSEGTGWDALKSTTMPVGNVVRTSSTVVTITLAAAGSYNITAQETVTVTVPASILTGAAAIVASPQFTIDTSGGGGGPTRGTPFGHEGTAFNGGRPLMGILR